jgi:hypothetical protein
MRLKCRESERLPHSCVRQNNAASRPRPEDWRPFLREEPAVAYRDRVIDQGLTCPIGDAVPQNKKHQF